MLLYLYVSSAIEEGNMEKVLVHAPGALFAHILAFVPEIGGFVSYCNERGSLLIAEVPDKACISKLRREGAEVRLNDMDSVSFPPPTNPAR